MTAAGTVEDRRLRRRIEPHVRQAIEHRGHCLLQLGTREGRSDARPRPEIEGEMVARCIPVEVDLAGTLVLVRVAISSGQRGDHHVVLLEADAIVKRPIGGAGRGNNIASRAVGVVHLAVIQELADLPHRRAHLAESARVVVRRFHHRRDRPRRQLLC